MVASCPCRACGKFEIRLSSPPHRSHSPVASTLPCWPTRGPFRPEGLLSRGTMSVPQPHGKWRLVFSQCSSRNKLLRALGWFETTCKSSITTSKKSRANIPSMRRPASKETTSDSVELCETEVSFLYIQLMGTNVRLLKIHKILDLNWSDRVFDSWGYTEFLTMLISNLQDHQQSLTLATIQIDSAVLYFLNGLLSVITRNMNVWYQTCQAFGTGSCPFCDCSCQFVYRPLNVWSTNAYQVQAFQFNLRAHLWQCSHRFQFLLLEMMVIQAKTWELCIVALSFCLPVHNIVQRISSHVLPCHKTERSCSRAIFQNQATFQFLRQRYIHDSNIYSVLLNPTFVKFTFASSASQEHMRFSQITTCVINFFRKGSRCCFFPGNFISHKVFWEKKTLLTMNPWIKTLPCVPLQRLMFGRLANRASSQFFQTTQIFSYSGGDSWYEHLFLFSKYFRSLCTHVEYISSKHGHETMSVLPDQRVSSISST